MHECRIDLFTSMWLKTERWFTSSCFTLLNQPGENCIDVSFSILFILSFSVLIKFWVIKSISSGAINTACILNHEVIRKPSYCLPGSCFIIQLFARRSRSDSSVLSRARPFSRVGTDLGLSESDELSLNELFPVPPSDL